MLLTLILNEFAKLQDCQINSKNHPLKLTRFSQTGAGRFAPPLPFCPAKVHFLSVAYYGNAHFSLQEQPVLARRRISTLLETRTVTAVFYT